MFFEHGMRGGVCYIHKRYSETSKNKHILYLDTNSLYECTMKQYLPTSNFKWVKNIHKIEQKLMNNKNNSSTGYVLEVNLEYPKNYVILIMIIH